MIVHDDMRILSNYEYTNKHYNTHQPNNLSFYIFIISIYEIFVLQFFFIIQELLGYSDVKELFSYKVMEEPSGPFDGQDMIETGYDRELDNDWI
jgi:hypothetical protein